MGLVQQDQQGQPTLTCPICRQVTPVPASGVAGLQADFHANQLLEIIEKEGKELFLSKPQVVRSEPASEEIAENKIASSIEMFCGTCGEAICWKCFHDKHHGHDCESLNEAFIRCKDNILSLLQAIDYTLTKLNACCDEISNQRSAIEEEIHSTIMMDDRKTELISQLHQLTQLKLKSLAAQRDQMETTQTQLNKNLHSMEDSGNQIVQITVVKQVKELNSALQPDLLKPKTVPDMVFANVCTIDGKIGVVYSRGSPDTSNCIITGDDYAEVRKRFITTLKPYNVVSSSSISCEVTSEIANTTTGCNIERKVENQYEISYTPTIKGRHKLHIKMKDRYITFLFFVRSQEDYTTSILTIGEVKGPQGVAVNKKGEIVVVAKQSGHCVTVFSQCGEKIRSFGTHGSGQGQFVFPFGLTLDGEENILITDWGNHRIQKFTPKGEFLTSVGTKGNGPLEFNCPCGIAYNANNDRLYVVDNTGRIQVLDSSLNYVGSFGKRGSKGGEFLDPCHIACDSSGNVYVTDWGCHSIQVFTAEGKFLRAFGEYRNLKKPSGIAIDYADRVYVSNWETNCISIYSPEGQFVTSFGKEDLKSPFGLAVDNCGVVYVCDFTSNCVKLF